MEYIKISDDIITVAKIPKPNYAELAYCMAAQNKLGLSACQYFPRETCLVYERGCWFYFWTSFDVLHYIVKAVENG